MAKVKNVEDLPDWFRLENYEYLRDLGATGWAIVVGALDALARADFTPEKLREITEEDGAEMSADGIFGEALVGSLDAEAGGGTWGSYSISKHKTNPENFCFRGVSSLSNGVVSYMAAELEGMPKGKSALRRARARLKATADLRAGAKDPRFPKVVADQLEFDRRPFFLELLKVKPIDGKPLTPNRAISVNMELPDALLIEDFKEWLSATRKLALHKAAHKSFSRSDFDKWVDERYVPLLLLDLWSKATGTQFTYGTLAAALFPKRGSTVGESHIRRSYLPGARAWCCHETREALAAQAAKEAGR